MKNNIVKMSGFEQARLISEKKVSPVEVIDAVFQLIHELNPKLNAFCTLNEEKAREEAKEAEKAIMRGEKAGPLHGVPISIKDMISTKGIRTTFGSKLYKDLIPNEDDICVERVRDAGAIIIGKTNVPEFGYQGVTDNELFGPTRSPWNENLTPGGSSGGSAVAVSCGMGALTIGNDGGGSIRIPSSFCGLYGMKPSFGRVPLYPGCRDPLYPGASGWESLECNGPMTRTVEDSALLLSIISGPSNFDRHSIPDEGLDYLEIIKNKDIKGLKIAYSPDWGYCPVDPIVREITERAVKVFEQLGCHVEEANPGFEVTVEQFWTLVARDTDLSALRKLAEKKPELFGPTMTSFINTKWNDEDLTNAHILRLDVNVKMRKFMQNYDLLLTPTLAVPPFEIGINGPSKIDGKNVSESDWLNFTYPINMTGQPAATIPAGWTEDGLPIGLQIIGRHLDDSTVLRASAAFEEANPWNHRWPNIKQLQSL